MFPIFRSCSYSPEENAPPTTPPRPPVPAFSASTASQSVPPEITTFYSSIRSTLSTNFANGRSGDVAPLQQFPHPPDYGHLPLVYRLHASAFCTGPSPFCLNTALRTSVILHTYLLAMTQLKDWVHLSVWSALHSAVLDSHELPSGISAGQFLLVTHLCRFFIDDTALRGVLRKKTCAG